MSNAPSEYWRYASLPREQKLKRLDELKKLLDEHTDLPPSLRGEYLSELGALHASLGMAMTEIHAILEESLAIYREIGDKVREAHALGNLANVHAERGEYESGLRYLEAALSLQRRIDDRQGEATTLGNIAVLRRRQGDLQTALQHLEAALAIQKALGNRSGEAWTLTSLAEIYRTQGDAKKALATQETALALQKRVGDRFGEATGLANISEIYRLRGDHKRATRYLKESLSIHRELGDRAQEGSVLNKLATLCHEGGDLKRALRYSRQSLEILQAIGKEASMCPALFNLGHFYLESRQQAKAFHCWVSAYRIARKLNLADALQKLDALARHFGESGLDYWEALSAHASLSDSSEFWTGS